MPDELEEGEQGQEPVYQTAFPQEQQDNSLPPAGLQNNPSALLKILETNPDLINFANRLRGLELVQDKESKQFVLKPAKIPKINEAGINYVFGALENVATVSAKTSNLEVERIYAMCRTEVQVITDGLFINQEAFGITDKDYEVIAPMITATCLPLMELILRHSEQGKTADKLFKTIRETKMDVYNSEPKKSGFWSNLNPFK
jgi:hypothetical protein